MTRTNLDLDEELVNEAMRRYGLPSKRAAVNFAFRRLVGDEMSRDEALQMEGSGWDADLEELRASDPSPQKGSATSSTPRRSTGGADVLVKRCGRLLIV